MPAAYRLRREGHRTVDFLWATAAFSAQFWAVGALLLVKTAMA